MKNLWNVRMRASKRLGRNLKAREVHISGAEGLYEGQDIQKATKKFIIRALEHPRGEPDRIFITIEKVKRRPKNIRSLPVSTIECKTPSESRHIIMRILKALGISEKSIKKAFNIVKRGNMRGAAIISLKKAHRFDPDKERGVRASRLGISKNALRELYFKTFKIMGLIEKL